MYVYNVIDGNKKRGNMIVPRVADNLDALMRQYVPEPFRPVLISSKENFEKGVIPRPRCKTDRPEFLVAVSRFQEERTDMYQKYKSLILPILLHPRHDHIRFSNKPGEQGFYVNQQAMNSSKVLLESISFSSSSSSSHRQQKMTNATFRRKAVRVRGLIGLIKRVFWPTYNSEVHTQMAKSFLAREKKKQQAKQRKKGKGKRKKKAKPKPAIRVAPKDIKSSAGCSWSTIDTVIHSRRGVGMELGKQIHAQLERFATDHIAFAMSKDPVDPITRAVIDKLVLKWKLIPLWGELQIWDEVLRYCTAIDMVCLDPKGEGRVVFLEIKTGYKEVFEYARRKVHGNVGIWDSPLGHAMIQLIVPIQTMKLRYGIQGIVGYVIHVNEMEGVTAYKLPVDNPRVEGGVSYARVYNYIVRCEEKGAYEPGFITGSNKRKRGAFSSAKSSPSSIVSQRTSLTQKKKKRKKKYTRKTK